MHESPAGQITVLLNSAGQGDRAASDALLPLVYDQLRELARRHMANEPAGLTLQPTALVHEAYLRLGAGEDLKWENRRHYFGAAAIAMRRILIERARRLAGPVHRQPMNRVELEDVPARTAVDPIDWIALDEGLTALEQQDPELAEIVSLRCFAGLSVVETAAALGISTSSIDRLWRGAKAFLSMHLEGDGANVIQ